eukprot:254756-Pleurochrysis_carterae.AAC.3
MASALTFFTHQACACCRYKLAISCLRSHASRQLGGLRAPGFLTEAQVSDEVREIGRAMAVMTQQSRRGGRAIGEQAPLRSVLKVPHSA